MVTFADLLQTYMNRSGTKNNEVAKAIGCNRNTIANWKKGASPSLKSRPKIKECARFLRLSPDETTQFLNAAFPKQPENLEDVRFREYLHQPENLKDVIFREYLQNILRELSFSNQVKFLLTPANWAAANLPFSQAILAQAKQQYSTVLCIRPPAGFTEDIPRCFSVLGEQCGFEDVKDSMGFASKLEERLNQVDKLCLIINRLEKFQPPLQQALLGTIDDILNRIDYPRLPRLHVMLWGGEGLENLLRNNKHPVLNIAQQVQQKPELKDADIQALYQCGFEGLTLDGNGLDGGTINAVLRISGGHPQLLIDCLKLRQNQPNLSWKDYLRILSQKEYVWRLFTPFIQDESKKQQVYQWLQQKRIRKAQPYIPDELLRELYWQNLLKEEREDDGKIMLYWRCEALRIAGKEILKPENRDGLE